jgi:hypothetical protein
MHYYPTNIELDIPHEYILEFISKNNWTRHKSTVSNRMTSLWYTPIWQNNNLINENWNPKIKTKIPRLKHSVILLKIPAHAHEPPHVDGDKNPRKTAWIFPLSESYAPTRFYEGDNLIDEYAGQMLLNTAKIHEVCNGEKDRYNLQICFEENIETVLEEHLDIIF